MRRDRWARSSYLLQCWCHQFVILSIPGHDHLSLCTTNILHCTIPPAILSDQSGIPTIVAITKKFSIVFMNSIAIAVVKVLVYLSHLILCRFQNTFPTLYFRMLKIRMRWVVIPRHKYLVTSLPEAISFAVPTGSLKCKALYISQR